jgi:hypothetical protein
MKILDSGKVKATIVAFVLCKSARRLDAITI